MTALQELLAKVEAGEKYETMGHTRMCQRAFPKPDGFDGSQQAYSNSNAQRAILAWRNGSLDAAKALHDAVLPDWRVTHAFGLVSGEIAKFNLTHNDKPVTYTSGRSDNPARAWLIAILKALIAQEATA